ncbi:hypothetical protein LN042_17440 [Kitasatospora sp. RB6PN24]|uniref:hypothetical protein n=1 Tax=Kitasatospora humi TaxID=2893891 RepID=UPI001E36B371|nr:hypothetical protein [Kitasatospora humi]MCC9308848.1 hypothetical protein [Kitasatospora humi]
MKRLARSLAVAAAAGSLTLLAAPASLAATSTTTASSCATFTASNSYGDGQITVCPTGGTSYQLSGYLETSMPDGGLWGPNCAGLDLFAGSTFLGIQETVCAQPGVATTKITFNNAATLSAMPTTATIQQVWI